MSVLATILLSWAAVHLFVASCYAFVSYRQRQGGEFLIFAVHSIVLAVYSTSAAIFLDAPDGLAASRAQGVELLAVAATFPTFVTFASSLLGHESPTWSRASLAFLVVSAVVVASNLAFDPGAPLATHQAVFSFAPRTNEVVTQPAGVAIYALSLLGILGYLASLRTEARRNPDYRALVLIAAVSLPALAVDTIARALAVRTFYLYGHFLVAATVLTSHVLMRRFVQVADELERRTLELRRSYDELRHVQEELVRKEQLAAVGELSAVIAHEVRNPLAVLKNAVSGLRRTELREEDRATLFTILDEETDRLNRLVRDLLSYARPVEPQATPLPIAETVRHAVDLACRGNARSSSIDVKVDLDGVPDSLEGDKDLIERAFINIVENALQAMPNGGRLLVACAPTEIDGEPHVALSFRDTGEGMDTLVRSRARDPFFTTRPSGTGLGLAIVERVIRAHGGTVELAKNEDLGSTVRVVLPLRRKLPV